MRKGANPPDVERCAKIVCSSKAPQTRRLRKPNAKTSTLHRRPHTWNLRRISALPCVPSSGADHVFSFLVTLFFTRVKKRVTRSSVGGVEALALKRETKSKNWIPACAGMTNPGLTRSSAGGVEALALETKDDQKRGELPA